MTEPVLDKLIEVRVEKLVYGGEGLGHSEGHTVFTPFVMPDEVASIEPLERRKKFIRGRTVRIVQPSPQRIEPPCPHFGPCGGCNYQYIPYELQLRYKSEILRETLARLGRIEWNGPIVPHGSPAYGYRNRTQWKVANAPNGSRGIGYFEAGSQKLCPIRVCPISSPHLGEALAGLLRLLAAGKLPADLREVEVFADADDSKLLLNLSFERFEGDAGQNLDETFRAEIPAVESLLVHDRRANRFELSGPGHLQYRVGAHEYQVGHLSFFQINRFLIEELVNLVRGDARGRLALDLFAGVGLFTVPLAHRFDRVIGVEFNAAATRDLEVNLRQSGAASPASREKDVEAFLARWREKPDFVVVDPPRAGVSAAALASLSKLAPRSIVYVSCDPATLARDLATLTGTAEKPGPYAIAEIHLLDIFPQTYHMEALVRLSRRA